MPFLGAIVRRPTNSEWGKTPAAQDFTRQEVGEMAPIGSLAWQLCQTNTETITLCGFCMAVNRSPQAVEKAVARLKHKYGLEIKFLPDEQEEFDHDDYKGARV